MYLVKIIRSRTFVRIFHNIVEIGTPLLLIAIYLTRATFTDFYGNTTSSWSLYSYTIIDSLLQLIKDTQVTNIRHVYDFGSQI